MKHRFPVVLCFSALTFFACSDGDSHAGGTTEAENSIAIVDKVVAGVSQKGPLINGSKIQIFELEGSTMIQTGSVFKGAVTSDNGDFSVAHINLKSQYALLEATGPYYSELTGKITASPITLNALTDLSDRENVNINLLTHMEYERALWLVHNDSLSVKDAKLQADREILSAFVKDSLDESPEDLNIFGEGESNAALLAVSVLMQLGRTESEFSKAVADFVGDIQQDGVWDDSTAKAFAADEAYSANLDSIRKNILSWKISEKIPAFEKYVELFWNGAYGLNVCNSEMEGAILPNVNTKSKLYKSKFRCKEGHWELYELFVEKESLYTTEYPEVDMTTLAKVADMDCSNSMYCPRNCRNVSDPIQGKVCSRVNTELDDGSDTYGYIWWTTDKSSNVVWPGGDLGYGFEAASRDKYGYLYGIAEVGDVEKPYAIVGFDVSGLEGNGNNLKDWKGLCVAYTSTEDMFITLRSPGDSSITNFDYYQAKLPATSSIVNADVSWDKFVQQGWGKKLNRDDVIQNVSQVHFKYFQPGIRASFKIFAIGKLGTCNQ